jgi:hypothetical protein
MNSRCLTLLTFGVFVVVTSSAQTSSQQSTAEVNRNETSGYIPQFTSKNKLGNSSIFQAGMDVGVNTTNPQATMDVESADIFGVLGNTSSRGLYATGVYGRTASTSGNGVAGDATATSGTNNGVFGRSTSANGIGVSGAATATNGGMGVYGQTAASSGYAAGVSGSAIADSGTTYGVVGQTYTQILISQRCQSRGVRLPFSQRLQHPACTGTQQIRDQARQFNVALFQGC